MRSRACAPDSAWKSSLRAAETIPRPAQRRDTVLGHAGDAQLLDQAVDLARGDAVDIGLEHDRHDRLLASPAGFEEAREVGRALALSGDQQLDLSDPRLPRPRAIAVAVRDALGAHLVKLGADLG